MNPYKNVKRLSLILILSLIVILAHGQDTLVKKKYLDSIKNQLASYTVTSYMHLNMFDRSQEEYRKLGIKYQIGQNQFSYILERRRRENIQYGIFFIALSAFFMVGIITLTK